MRSWRAMVAGLFGQEIRRRRQNRFSASPIDRVKSSRRRESYTDKAISPAGRIEALSRISGVHSQDRAGDVAAAVAQQIFHHAGHVVGFRQAAQRAAARDALTLLRAEAVRQFGVDEARSDGIHRDAKLADLARQRTG